MTAVEAEAGREHVIGIWVQTDPGWAWRRWDRAEGWNGVPIVVDAHIRPGKTASIFACLVTVNAEVVHQSEHASMRAALRAAERAARRAIRLRERP